MSLTIRAIAASDRADWQRLWAGYLAFYDTEVSDEVYDTSFARLLSDEAHEFRGLLAFQGEQAVGLAHYLLHRDLWSLADTCYLSDLFVDPAQRGTGAGRALIEAASADAAQAGAHTLHWLTARDNSRARALYDQIARLEPFVQYSLPLTLTASGDAS